MSIEEKRAIISDYCLNGSPSCSECVLRNQNWIIPYSDENCINIHDSDEGDLDKAIKLIEESKELGKAHDTDKLEKVLSDSVNSPSHYTDGKIEVIDYIEDKKLGFCLGNAIKYISRAGKKDKDKEVEDCKKAIWYLKRHIKNIEEAN